jgi:Heparinase II/III N-terminus/Heparinase II/III-like protein
VILKNAIHGYEKLSNTDPKGVLKLADDILANGWKNRGYPTVHLSKNIDWQMAEIAHRSWNFRIHSLNTIDALLMAFDVNGNQTYLQASLAVALDWISKHPRDAEDVSPMAWYDMAVGLRAYKLGYIYERANSESLLSKSQKTAFWTSLEEHRVELENDSNIAFHNNHGYYQVAGQLALGRRFASVSSEMKEFFAQGKERMRYMLDQQFTKEGVHREHSPDYHRMVLDTLMGLVKSGLIDDSDLVARAREIEEALARFVCPDGTIVNFGDSDTRSLLRSEQSALNKWTTPVMQDVANRNGTGKLRPVGMKIFHETGYAIIREPNQEDPDNPKQDSYLAQTATFHSRTHKHADDLSFVWHENGCPILTDAGRFGYLGGMEQGSDLWKDGHWYSHPMRVHIESTRAHNTLEFDNRNFLRKGAAAYGSAILRSVEKEGDFVVETRCKQFRSIWHNRVLFFRPGASLVVLDVFNDNLKKPHDIKQWFHLAHTHTVAQVAGGFDAELSMGKKLKIRSLLPEAIPGEVIVGGEDPVLQGWWSGKEREALPAPAFSFGMTEACRGVFATVLSLSDKIDVDLIGSRSNVTGRKGRFRWTDSHGTHDLNFERQDKLDFTHVINTDQVDDLSLS